jgi:hypothetical protein
MGLDWITRERGVLEPNYLLNCKWRGCVEREVLRENEQRGPLRKAAALGELTVSLLTQLWSGVATAKLAQPGPRQHDVWSRWKPFDDLT